MNLTRALATSSVFAILAGPALADLTAEEVLADQLAQMSIYGFDVETVGQSKVGNVLTVESLAATAEIPEENISMGMTVGGATFTERGDGSVLVTYPATIPVKISMSIPDVEDNVSVDMTVTQDNLQMLVTGDPEQLSYEITGSNVGIRDFIVAGPDETGDIDMAIDVDMAGLVAVMNIGGGTTIRPYDIDMAVNTVRAAIKVMDPNESADVNLTFQMDALKAVYEGTMAPQELMDSFAEVIQKGNVSSGTFSHGQASYDMNVDGPEGSFQGQASVGSGDFTVAMNAQGLDYGGTSKDVTATFGGSMIPFPPMSISMAETGGRFQIPVIPGETPQDFAFVMSLIGLELDPFLWGMFDPTGQLPQDPATLIIDTDGELVMLQDVFAADFAEEAMLQGPPGQINALNINEIKLSLAGAELTGDGALTFNNDSGIPMPIGTINMMLKGGNTLLDTLVSMGLIPQEQAMGARMMTGMFARPGEGPDTLVSTIEMQADGAILANGQRIR